VSGLTQNDARLAKFCRHTILAMAAPNTIDCNRNMNKRSENVLHMHYRLSKSACEDTYGR
jgi:hypothetical protein